jgi:hypothetical protein
MTAGGKRVRGGGWKSAQQGFKRSRVEVMMPGIAFTVGNLARTQQATSCLIEAIQPLILAHDEQPRGNGSTLSDALQEELGELRASKKQIRSGGDLCKGVAYITVQCGNANKRPSELVHSLLSDEDNKLPAFVSRIIPFDYVTSPHFRNASDLVIARIKPFFESIIKPTTWNMKFSKHAMSSIDQNEILSVLIDEIPARHEPSVMGSEWTVLIDVTPVLCGMSVVSDFERLCEYNVNRISKLRERAVSEE